MLEIFLIAYLTLTTILCIFGVVFSVYHDVRYGYKMNEIENHNDDDVIQPWNPQPHPVPPVSSSWFSWLSSVKQWAIDQKDKAKVAWTICVGVALFLGYDLAITPIEPDPEPPLKIEQIYEPYQPVDGHTTIVVEGEVKAINGYRIRKINGQ